MVRISYWIGFSALLSAAAAKEMAVNEVAAQELYDSGYIHQSIMGKKKTTWDRQRAEGRMDSTQYEEIGYVECVDGIAEAVAGDKNQTFKCSNADLYHFLPHSALGSETGEGSSSWGWTSSEGREYVAVAQADGAAFVEITSEGKMVYLGRLPQYSEPSIWREIRGFKNYMIIGSEAEGHGIQIFDMEKLVDLDGAEPVTFTQEDLTGHFTDLPAGRTHNVVINEENDYVVSVGAQPRNSTCRSGLIFIDLSDPANPTTPGCAADDGYVHDAQCLVYRGPDERYDGSDICYGYNEDTLTIYDVSEKDGTNIISRTSYEGASYTHQGWVLDPQNQEYLVLDDEYDEYDGAGPGADGFPVTFIWDIRDLENPKQTGYYKSPVRSVDHNHYVSGGLIYQSHYGAGLRVLDGRSIPEDPTGAGICEVAHFDVYPEDDEEEGGGVVEFVGSWSSYALFESGFIFVNTIERGAWVVKLQSDSCPGAAE